MHAVTLFHLTLCLDNIKYPYVVLFNA